MDEFPTVALALGSHARRSVLPSRAPVPKEAFTTACWGTATSKLAENAVAWSRRNALSRIHSNPQRWKTPLGLRCGQQGLGPCPNCDGRRPGYELRRIGPRLSIEVADRSFLRLEPSWPCLSPALSVPLGKKRKPIRAFRWARFKASSVERGICFPLRRKPTSRRNTRAFVLLRKDRDGRRGHCAPRGGATATRAPSLAAGNLRPQAAPLGAKTPAAYGGGREKWRKTAACSGGQTAYTTTRRRTRYSPVHTSKSTSAARPLWSTVGMGSTRCQAVMVSSAVSQTAPTHTW